jgi:hypothetical protein
MGRVDRIAEPWGTRTPYGPGQPWPQRVDMRLELAKRCHPQTLRQMRWADAKLKETAAQVMVTP